MVEKWMTRQRQGSTNAVGIITKGRGAAVVVGSPDGEEDPEGDGVLVA